MEKPKYDIQKEVIGSRFQRTLIHCPNPECEAPIAERLGNTWWYQRFQNGQSVKSEVRMTPASGSSYRIECPICGFAHIFAVIEEAIHIDDDFTIKSK